MRRTRACARAALAAAVAGAVGLLAGCGSGHHAASTSAPSTSTPTPTPTTTSTSTPAAGSLSITPGAPRPSSEIRFGFTAPTATGRHGGHVISYSLSVAGLDRTGCIGAHEATAPAATTGETVSITLGPAELNAPWCPGPYTARMFELERAYCRAGVPCPQYVRVVGVAARATFRVTGG